MTWPLALLWDMDGTLTDTESYWFESELEVIHEYGGTWTHEDQLDLVGQDLLTSAGVIMSRTPVRMEPVQLVERLLDGVVRRMHQTIPWRPGALDLLASAREAGARQALVTMSWTALADVMLAGLPQGTFDAVVTGDQVQQGKPHPEPYLLAAERLGVRPEACMAIEDSRNGVASSVAAGVPTLAVPHLLDIAPQAGVVVTPTLAGVSYEDLPGLFGRTA